MAAPFFSGTIAAVLGGQTVRMALLLEFLLGTPFRIWLGYGNIITSDGKTWQGFGDVGTIQGLEQAINGAAPQASFTLSGVTPEIVTALTDTWQQVRYRQMNVYLQFVDASSGALLDGPAAINRFTMEQVEITFTGPGKRDVMIHCENIFTARGFPQFGWLSDRDQQSRHPGDTGLARIPILQYHVVTWPPA